MKLTLELPGRSYDILIERGIAAHPADHLALDRRVLIVTDDGVPDAYAARVAAACAAPTVITVPQGEESKSPERLLRLLGAMLDAGFTRTDAVVAVGGGVIGDLAGFAAACFMRGIDFYNIPTTLLSQVDSSIGGKTAINLGGVKNIVGAFHQPKKVLIDPDLLATLPARHMANGMAEIIKMAMTSDADLFSMLEGGVTEENLPEVIRRALLIKKQVVEQDECESGLRRILNFGHTFGHGIESAAGLSNLLHGESVALGMLPLCAPELRPRLTSLLSSVGLPTRFTGDVDAALDAVAHDKKMSGQDIRYIYVPAIGSYEIKSLPLAEFRKMIKEAL